MKKFSMEIMYVPQATVSQKKEMVLEWRTESEKVYKFSMISAAVSLVVMLLFLFEKEEFWYIYAGAILISVLSGYMAKKWSLVGYGGVFAALLTNCLWFSVGFPQSYTCMGSILLAAVCGVLPCFSAVRCIFNYAEVFVPLKNSKGFPDFIMSTSDIYGDKLYLKDKPDENIHDNKYEASYNPFKTRAEMEEEEFRRNLDLKSSGLNEVITMNIDAEDTETVVTSEDSEGKSGSGYKYGKKFGDFEIVFLHNDPEDMSFQEKAILMGKWRENIQRLEKNFNVFFLLVAVACMADGFGDFIGTVVNYTIILLFAVGIVGMKTGRTYGALTVLGTIVYSFIVISGQPIAVFLLCGAYAVNFGIIVSPVIFLLNKPLYNTLSTMSGFPTFIRTTSDIYGSKMYIIEERPRVEKKTNKDHFITMDIGYGDEPKKSEEDKGWNAFDYMDEQKEENKE